LREEAFTGIPALEKMTTSQAGALTVAGQRRIHTAFPNILATLFSCLGRLQWRTISVIKRSSMTSTLDIPEGNQVKNPDTQRESGFDWAFPITRFR
jgi:hypothetical protein